MNNLCRLRYSTILLRSGTFETIHFQRNFSIESLANGLQALTYKFAASKSVEVTTNIITSIHDTTGLPWWATIISSAILLRGGIMFPLVLWRNRILGKVENVKLELLDFKDGLNIELARKISEENWTRQEAELHFYYEIRKEKSRLYEKDNCHPFKATLMIFAQIPPWILVSGSLRNMCNMMPAVNSDTLLRYLQLSEQGIAWFTDMTTPDSYYVLPLSLCLVNLILIEVRLLSKIIVTNNLVRYVLHFSRGVNIILIPVCMHIPTSVLLFWLTSNFCALTQTFLLMSPRFRYAFGIPDTVQDLEHPYKEMFIAFKYKIDKIRLFFIKSKE